MDMDLGLILGPIVLAVVFNGAVYGTCVIQWYNYYTSGYKDPWYTRLLVAWVVFLDTFHTAAATYMLWDFVVPNFGKPEVFVHLPWPYPTTPIFICLASVPIQIFLAYRIKGLSHSWLLFLGLAALSLAQGACGIAGGILATINPDPIHFAALLPLANSWISIAVFVDVAVTLSLFYYLRRSKTGFKRTDNVIERLIRTAIETASIGAVFCIIDVIVFTTRINTNLHFFFALPQGRIYTNTLMMTLNSRANLREEMNSTGVHSFNVTGSGSGNMRRKTEVSIGITQSIQMDRIPSANGQDQESYDERKIATVA
ncbi:hypothetical protein BJ322DRAFT_1047759 [Thelephora terrestris]|jgi:hypothetical protein|uniref:DUF6534 domain-containing protein n=1 Tax=Thelephora terrestris TaxID=56493 RepID=A0A9P6HJ44_9AGAM|nr:hypothetical protein BJ322DRAFT_1047759 [Thelephora terrestris]